MFLGADVSLYVPVDRVGRVMDEGIRDILGDAAASVSVRTLGEKLNMGSPEIAGRPEDFSASLIGFFGSGAEAVERCLVHSLSNEFGSEFSSRPFLEVVSEIVGSGNESG